VKVVRATGRAATETATAGDPARCSAINPKPELSVPGFAMRCDDIMGPRPELVAVWGAMNIRILWVA
jgi:hypothetical protein